LRGVGAWSCFVKQGRWSLAEKHIWEDLQAATSLLFNQGVLNTTQQLRDRLPKFECKLDIIHSMAQLLPHRLIKWNGMFVFRHEGPPAGVDKDPPSAFVTDILNLITEDKSVSAMDHAQEVSRAISQAFWDVACMAIHPQLFDYPAENGGCGVRKTTPTAIALSLGPPSYEEALRLVVAAF
jgi:hypothetical protein